MLLSGHGRSLFTVKISAIFLTMAGLLVLPGCWVQSINGLYDAGLFASDKDQFFDSGLLGTWSTKLDKCSTTVTISAEGKEYQWLTSSEGEGGGSDK